MELSLEKFYSVMHICFMEMYIKFFSFFNLLSFFLRLIILSPSLVEFEIRQSVWNAR